MRDIRENFIPLCGFCFALGFFAYIIGSAAYCLYTGF